MSRVIYNPFDILLRRLGAAFAWCHTNHGRSLDYCLLYWPPLREGALSLLTPQVLTLPAINLSGFMSQHRGLRWDNRSRRGLK